MRQVTPKPKPSKKKLSKPSMKAVFAKVWQIREHFCNRCGAQIYEPLAECFAHLIGKNNAKSRKHDPEGIILVCANGVCHHRVDTELRPAAMAAMNNESKPAIGYPKPR
jgi:hypothetical protein